MNPIQIETTEGKTVTVSEQELLRTGIAYLRRNHPNNAAIVAEEINDEGLLKEIPAAVFMLLKNPHDAVYYTHVVKLEIEEES